MLNTVNVMRMAVPDRYVRKNLDISDLPYPRSEQTAHRIDIIAWIDIKHLHDFI